MFVNILIGLAVLLVALLIFIALRPADFRVSRSATIAATPADVFAHVNDFHQWEAWSPWAKLDPNSTASFEGPSSGTGALFRWSGNREVGEGAMTILESRPPDRIRIQLDFLRPFVGTNDVEFTFQPQGANSTAVTWSIAGKNNFMSKAVGLFIDCEKLTGGMFEKGLASLKGVVEAAVKP